MVEFLISLLPTCLIIWAIHILFQEEHLLGKVGTFFRGPRSEDDEEETLREYLMRPIFDCPICMSSVWGTIGFFALDYFFGVHLPYKLLIPYVLALCGLNTILVKFTTKERIIVEE